MARVYEHLWGPVLTAMATPFTAAYELDVAGAARLARYLVDSGSDGLVVGATTGEGPALTDEERLRLWETVLEAVGDRAPVWASVGTYNTHHSQELAQAAHRLGVAGLLVVTPYYNRPPQAGLFDHFRRVAEATPLPVMLYNVPSRTGVNLEPSTVARLAREVPTIQGIKEAHADLGQAADLLRAVPEGFHVLSGDDAFTFPLLCLGGHGVVSVVSHVAGPAVARMIAAVEGGDLPTARRLHLELVPLTRALFLTTNPIPVKAALEMLGLPAGPVRPPLCPLSQEQRQVVRAALDRLPKEPFGNAQRTWEWARTER
jgi:4-hydroxy-tetrahydrodipicolinate synthase